MDAFKAWLARPFDADMSAFQWFLFWGLLIIIAVAWKLILSSFEEIAG